MRPSTFVGVVARAGGVVGGAPPETLLLDTVTSAAVAFSLRKIRTAYAGSCIRVRRSSDNTEQDIGFSGNDFDSSALSTFCGGGNGFIVTWYDQSGNDNHAVQATTLSQPTIYSSGALITRNSKAACLYNSQFLELGSNVSGATAWFSSQVIGRSGAGVRAYGLATSVHTAPFTAILFSDSVLYVASDSKFALIADASTVPVLISSSFVGTTLSAWKNGSALSLGSETGVSGTSFRRLGSRIGESASGYMQELILWSSDKTGNRTTVESDMNTYWGVY